MARRPEADRRQADFFGVPAPAPSAPEHRPNSTQKPKPGIKRQPPPPDIEETLLCDSIDVLAARLSRTGWNELVAGLPDGIRLSRLTDINLGLMLARAPTGCG